MAGEAQASTVYAAVLGGNADTVNVSTLYVTTLGGVTETARIYAAYVVIMVPVNSKLRRQIISW